MSEALIINLITSLPALIAAIAGLYYGIRGTREAAAAKQQTAATAKIAEEGVAAANDKIERIHISINSRMDELLKSARAESRAEGVEAGRGAESVVPIPVPIPRAREAESDVVVTTNVDDPEGSADV